MTVPASLDTETSGAAEAQNRHRAPGLEGRELPGGIVVPIYLAGSRGPASSGHLLLVHATQRESLIWSLRDGSDLRATQPWIQVQFSLSKQAVSRLGASVFLWEVTIEANSPLKTLHTARPTARPRHWCTLPPEGWCGFCGCGRMRAPREGPSRRRGGFADDGVLGGGVGSISRHLSPHPCLQIPLRPAWLPRSASLG